MATAVGWIVLALIAQTAFGQRVITTFAGTDSIPITGGIPAIGATIGVNAVSADRAGNFYICDEFQNVVYKVDSLGSIVVLAGNGIKTFSGDGGLATDASLNEPQDVAVDPAGNIYISDSFNNRIRKIDAQGIITTVAGNGQAGSSGDGGPAAQAALNRPYRIALDSTGNLYIVDSLNNRIRKVDPQGTITTAAGAGPVGFAGDGGPAKQALLGSPVGIAVSASDVLYIADKDNHRIRTVDPQGIITTIAGTGQAGFSGDNGPARNATFYQPYGLAFDSRGNLFVVDYVNDRIRRIDTAGIVTTVAGNGQRGFNGDGGPATAATLEFPFSVKVDSSDRLLISDTFNIRIRRVSQGIISTAAGSGKLQNPADNGPATSARFNYPGGLTVDRNGVVYVADTIQNLIRRIDTSGAITTVAGNGLIGFSGDGGPAVNASFNAPDGVAVDATGNLYIADTFNHRIRRVTPQGIVTTVAGSEFFGALAGDNGPANRAALNLPRGVALDGAGNLYIADSGNNAIRKVTPAGVITSAAAGALKTPVEVLVDAAGSIYICDLGNNRIRKVTATGVVTTVAGNGQADYSGDGGPAAAAALNNPAGIGLDSAGNLYIADTLNNRIRVVDVAQTISTFAGNGVRGFAGDGNLASLATLGAPEGVWPVASGDVFLADTRNQRIRRVLALPPSFDVSGASLTFAASSDGEAAPEQAVGVSASIVGVPFSAAVTTTGATWLKLNSSAAVTSGRIGVVADPAQLPPGTYQASFTVTALNALPRTRVVSVIFTVGAAAPAKLSVTPKAVSFAITGQTQPQTQTLSVTNAGGGALDFLVAASALTGETAWLSVSTDSGSVRPGAPVSVIVTVDPSNLAPGSYNGLISFASPTTGETLDIPVSLGVTAVQRKILLSQTGLAFTAVAGGGDTPPQSFSVANDGQGSLNFSVGASALAGGAWLATVQDSGSTDAGGAPANLDVVINPSGLAPGRYTGLVRLDAPEADNSPQFVAVYLNVLPAGSNPGPTLQPTTLRFTGVAGGANPGSQTILVYNTTATPVSFTSSRAFFEGREWFVHIPSGGTARKDQPVKIIVQPSIAGLAAGARSGTLNIQFSDGSVRAIGILLVLSGDAGLSALSSKERQPSAGGCAASRLLPAFTSLTQDFSVSAGWPVSLQMQVTDDCGNALTAGSVTASFSNGDPVLPLTSLKDGRWGATWQARSARPGVTVSINASSPATGLKGTTSLTGGVSLSSSPIVNSDGIVSSASRDGRLPPAPGGMISILGSSLSDRSEQADDAGALPTQLGGTTVLLAGRLLPLLAASDGRIDAILPFDLPVSARHQLIVQRGTSLTVPSTVTMSPVQPAIFTKDDSGTGQGKIYRVLDDGSSPLAEPESPAHAGDTVTILATGLGAVNADVQAGTPGPSNPPAATVNPVTVSIGGVETGAVFAGLLPGASGFYQLKVVIPEGAPQGDAIPAVLRVAGQSSPAVTMAIR